MSFKVDGMEKFSTFFLSRRFAFKIYKLFFFSLVSLSGNKKSKFVMENFLMETRK